MEINSNIAYLRELTGNKQCELLFHLTISEEIFGIAIDEDIRAVRRLTDNVSSTLQHINNKVAKMIQDGRKAKRLDEAIEVVIPLSLSRDAKPLKGGTVLRNLIIKRNTLAFKIFEEQYVVVINAPLVNTVQLPEVIYSNFSVQPVKLKADHFQFDISLYRWYKSEDKEKWLQVGNQYHYSVEEDDVNHYLKFVVIPRNEHCWGPVVEKISKSKVEIMSNFPMCPFESRHVYTKDHLKNNEFRIVSYNILASRYSETNEQFPYCTPQFLSIDYRKQLIIKEILGYNADIICLQEVDSKQYATYFKDEFKDNGFTSVYHKKGFRIPEGLACIFKRSRFTLAKSQQLVLAIEIQRNKLFSRLWDIVKRNEAVKRFFISQATSLQVSVLKDKETKMEIIVGNTHLFYRPDATHIRLLQISMATLFINYLRNKSIKDGNNVCVILCGDLNSNPSSPVVSYLIDGRIDSLHEECCKVSNGGLQLYHEMCLESACGFPKYTNYTSIFKDCLDYIFVEKNKASVLRSIPLPTEEELAEHEGLPNQVYPSDHLALVVDIKLT